MLLSYKGFKVERKNVSDEIREQLQELHIPMCEV